MKEESKYLIKEIYGKIDIKELFAKLLTNNADSNNIATNNVCRQD